MNIDYNSSHDHSKWAITATKKSKNHWVCIGDINRAVSFIIKKGFSYLKINKI